MLISLGFRSLVKSVNWHRAQSRTAYGWLMTHYGWLAGLSWLTVVSTAAA